MSATSRPAGYEPGRYEPGRCWNAGGTRRHSGGKANGMAGGKGGGGRPRGGKTRQSSAAAVDRMPLSSAAPPSPPCDGRLPTQEPRGHIAQAGRDGVEQEQTRERATATKTALDSGEGEGEGGEGGGEEAAAKLDLPRAVSAVAQVQASAEAHAGQLEVECRRLVAAHSAAVGTVGSSLERARRVASSRAWVHPVAQAARGPAGAGAQEAYVAGSVYSPHAMEAIVSERNQL